MTKVKGENSDENRSRKIEGKNSEGCDESEGKGITSADMLLFGRRNWCRVHDLADAAVVHVRKFFFIVIRHTH